LAQIERSVNVDAPVDTVHEEWLRFEDRPSCAVHALVSSVRWRAEVLTLEPRPDGTRITLKIEYDPGGADAGLPRRLEGVLQSFTSFFERRHARAEVASPA
jgi:hypothetical protein